ncbi:G-protein beta WD-40 repeats containing protein, partial [Reticulomyxa filosa]
SEEEKIQVIVQHWIRILKIKLGWINEFDKLVVNYTLCIVLIIQHLMIVNSFVLDQMIKQFVYGILITTNYDNKMNNIGVIGGNGYTICSGSFDKTIRIWDIETTKQLNIFKGHEDNLRSVKYGSNELVNTILSGSADESVRLWDIRSDKQIQVFNGHTNIVWSVEYSPFVIKNSICNSNVICSGSDDNTIRFWDIRSNKNELYIIKGDDKKDNGILCLKFIRSKKKDNTKNVTYDLNLCYGSNIGHIRIWG